MLEKTLVTPFFTEEGGMIRLPGEGRDRGTRGERSEIGMPEPVPRCEEFGTGKNKRDPAPEPGGDTLGTQDLLEQLMPARRMAEEGLAPCAQADLPCALGETQSTLWRPLPQADDPPTRPEPPLAGGWVPDGECGLCSHLRQVRHQKEVPVMERKCP